MRFAYADPPYLGQGAKLYGDATYDDIEAHADLLDSLTEYDGWAYSLSSTTLRELLPLAPEAVRVGAWVKPWCSFKKGQELAYAWEPVLLMPGRKPSGGQYERDYVAASAATGRELKGAKPDAFCYWLFRVLGMREGDELVDLFPGTGAVMEAWQQWSGQMALFGQGGGDAA